MRRSSLGAVLLLALFTAADVRAAGPSWVGTWVLTEIDRDEEADLFLLKITEKDGKPLVEVLSAGAAGLAGSKVEEATLDDRSIKMPIANRRFALNTMFLLPVEKSKKMYGYLELGDQRSMAELERSDLTQLDLKKGPNLAPAQALKRALASEEKEPALKALLEKYADRPLAIMAGVELTGTLAQRGAAEKDIREAADAAVKLAGRYGPEMKTATLRDVTARLTGPEKTVKLAVEYAQQAVKLLPESEKTSFKLAVLKAQLAALRKAKKAEEAKAVETVVAKLDEELDRDFLKTAVPFKPEVFAGRRGKSDRVVLVELFTGSECPPCVAADAAFDGLLQTYKPTEVVFLQYHLHVPRPDALTNTDSMARAGYYGEKVRGTPTFFIDGNSGPGVGGPKGAAQKGYASLRDVIDNTELEREAAAQIKLTAERKDNQLDLQAAISGLKTTGDKVRLRFVLVEEVVRYPGGNGQRLHHQVVRAFPGGVEGIALKAAAGKESAKVDLAEVAKSIDAYLSDYQSKPPKKAPFRSEYGPLDFSKLKVVAFIQNDDNQEILQAVQVNLPEGK